MLSYRPTPKDRENLELIKEYLELHRPEVQYAKTSDAIRYAIEMAAIGIRQEQQAGPPPEYEYESLGLSKEEADELAYYEQHGYPEKAPE